MIENNQINVDDLPDINEIEFVSIHKDYFKVILLNLLLFFGVAFGILIALDFFRLREELSNHIYLFYIVLALLLGAFFVSFYIGFSRRKYAVRSKDISYEKGVLTTLLTIVPYNRIQHIEINEGLFSRWFKLASIEIFTAGASGKDLVISGILKTEALKIKAFITQAMNDV
ncbi:MAG: hypothetical protein COB73_02605 [Flavobacteriaceae bacterium]|nr:MAG: hypothetical protein COB73_02605 [Flavobacteriaceae bacterium]